MKRQQIKSQSLSKLFLVRWFVSSLGLWIAAAILGHDRLSVGDHWVAWIIAGFILALVNMFIRPLLVLFSFSAIALTLGLFMLVINGFLIILVSWIYNTLYVKNLGVAIVAGMILGLVNWLVSQVLEDFNRE
jgi:putative membrane protein